MNRPEKNTQYCEPDQNQNLHKFKTSMPEKFIFNEYWEGKPLFIQDTRGFTHQLPCQSIGTVTKELDCVCSTVGIGYLIEQNIVLMCSNILKSHLEEEISFSSYETYQKDSMGNKNIREKCSNQYPNDPSSQNHFVLYQEKKSMNCTFFGKKQQEKLIQQDLNIIESLTCSQSTSFEETNQQTQLVFLKNLSTKLPHQKSYSLFRLTPQEQRFVIGKYLCSNKQTKACNNSFFKNVDSNEVQKFEFGIQKNRQLKTQTTMHRPEKQLSYIFQQKMTQLQQKKKLLKKQSEEMQLQINFDCYSAHPTLEIFLTDHRKRVKTRCTISQYTICEVFWQDFSLKSFFSILQKQLSEESQKIQNTFKVLEDGDLQVTIHSVLQPLPYKLPASSKPDKTSKQEITQTRCSSVQNITEQMEHTLANLQKRICRMQSSLSELMGKWEKYMKDRIQQTVNKYAKSNEKLEQQARENYQKIQKELKSELKNQYELKLGEYNHHFKTLEEVFQDSLVGIQKSLQNQEENIFKLYQELKKTKMGLDNNQRKINTRVNLLEQKFDQKHEEERKILKKLEWSLQEKQKEIFIKVEKQYEEMHSHEFLKNVGKVNENIETKPEQSDICEEKAEKDIQSAPEKNEKESKQKGQKNEAFELIINK